jgi:hypothetical protein
MNRAVILLAVAVCTSGCMAARAQAPVERPALDVPPVPPRIIEPAPPPQAAYPDPVPPLPPEDPQPVPASPPRPAAASGAAAKETQKTEVKPEAAAPEPVADAPPPPVVALRTPATANAAVAQRQIEETLHRAQKSLDSVDYQRLTELRKKAYNEAKDFISESEAHLKNSNLEVAKELADKAEKYATVLLQGR